MGTVYIWSEILDWGLGTQIPGLGTGLPGASDDKKSACNIGGIGLIPGSGRSPGEGNGNPLQYSCLENSMDRGTWCAIVHEVAESDMTEQITHTQRSQSF